MSAARQRDGFAILLFLCSVSLAATGIYVFASLSEVYRSNDIAYAETEQTFYDWLSPLIQKHGINSPNLVDLTNRRLLVMGTTERRNAINSMMIDVFWDEVATRGTDRLAIHQFLNKVARKALHSLPLAGDLWLLIAWLRTKQLSFDNTATNYLILSQRYSPRERALALQRLDLITQTSTSIPTVVMDKGKKDLSIIERVDPQKAKDYSNQLYQ